MKCAPMWLFLVAFGCASQGGGPPRAEDARAAEPGDAGNPPVDAGEPPMPADMRAGAIYLAMPDRFANGDPANDDLGVPSCSDLAEERHWHGGDLAGLTARVPYLAELGVGALWTTPVYRQTTCHGYHGYWGDFVDPPVVELEPKLGTAAELDGLLAALHEAGIRYLLDMIVNHAGRGARVIEQHPDWFHDPETCGDLGAEVIFCPLSRLPDFAQEHAAVADYLDQLSRLWVERFAIDGIRMDTFKHVPASYFADRWVPAVRAARPGMFLVGEVFDGSGPAAYQTALDAGFDSTFDFALYYALVDTFGRRQSTNRAADAVARTIEVRGHEQATWMTTMIANHDVPRFAAEMSAGMSAAEQRDRHRLALVALFTLPGIPQLYAGDEVGMVGSWPDNRRIMPGWLWTAVDRAGDHPEALPGAGDTFDLTARLTRLRRDHPAIWRGSYTELWRQNGGPPVWAYQRADGDARLVAVFNNGADRAALSIPLPAGSADGAALDLLGGPDATVAAGALSVDLAPRSAAVYRTR